MNVLNTKAIVLSSLKYGESSLIIRCYTLDAGLKSFIIKGVFSKKKRNLSLYFPLNEISISFITKSNDQQLFFLNSAQTSYYYESLHTHPVKSTIVFFLAEVLNLILKEETANAELYSFILNSLKQFDHKEDFYSDFHLIFMVQLSQFLGFYPNIESDGGLFDLENGFFSNTISSTNMLNTEETLIFKKLLSANLINSTKNMFNQSQRSLLLNILIKYYQIHTHNFKKPKSLQVLHELFS